MADEVSGGGEEKKPGFYCKECGFFTRDPLEFLEHVNKTRHNIWGIRPVKKK